MPRTMTLVHDPTSGLGQQISHPTSSTPHSSPIEHRFFFPSSEHFSGSLIVHDILFYLTSVSLGIRNVILKVNILFWNTFRLTEELQR